MMPGLEFIILLTRCLPQLSELVPLVLSPSDTSVPQSPAWDQGSGVGGEGWPCPRARGAAGAAPLPDEGKQLLLKRGWSDRE